MFELFNQAGKPADDAHHIADDGPARRRSAAGMKFFEDIAIGERAELGQHTFTAEDDQGVCAAASIRRPFHLDEAAAARSHFGALCASGWHTASVWMRLMVEHQRRDDEARRDRGEPVAQLGPSPGFRELKWLKPVYVGDTVTYAMEIVEARASNSRPDWGLITMRNTGVNQKGEPVISFVSVAFVERRNGTGSRMSVAAPHVAEPAGSRGHQGRGAPRHRRRLRRACAARRLHRPDLRDAADLAGRVRPRLCRARSVAHLLLRHHGGAANSVRRCCPSGSACRWCWRRAPRSPASAICSPAPASASVTLVIALLIGGLGASTQHPLASALVARAFAGPRSMKALGTYNFAGDIGKMSLPALASLMLVRAAVAADARDPGRDRLRGRGGDLRSDAALSRRSRGAGGREAKAAVDGGRPRCRLRLSRAAGDRHGRQRHAHGLPDFLPFVLLAKGASLPTVGLALTLVFAGGAAGKLVCAFIGARIGVIATVCLTEGLTTLGILALLPLPLEAAMLLLAGDRHRAQRHLVGAVRLGAGIGGAGAGARARSASSTPARSAQAPSRRRSTDCSATP